MAKGSQDATDTHQNGPLISGPLMATVAADREPGRLVVRGEGDCLTADSRPGGGKARRIRRCPDCFFRKGRESPWDERPCQATCSAARLRIFSTMLESPVARLAERCPD